MLQGHTKVLKQNAYVAGETASSHACAVKIGADGAAIVYTAILAGSNQEFAGAVVVDSAW